MSELADRPRLADGPPAGWGAAVIAAAVLVVFWPALHGGWLWDDGLEITNNPLLRDAGGWWKAWTAPQGLDYLPLKGSLQWIEWHLWGPHPLGYHVMNVGLHAIGALLLWRVLAQLGVAAAWWGGLLFAIHPAVVESVAWISEFKNVVSLPPLLLAWTAFLRFDASGRTRWGCLAAALGWFAASLLCKASGVMLPVLLLVYVWWRRGRIGWADVGAAAPFFVLSLLCGLVTLEFQWHRAMATVAPVAGEWQAQVAQAGWTLLAYMRTAFFPLHLAPVYAPWLSSWPAWIPWCAVGAVAAICWIYRAIWGRHAGFAGAWFLLNLLPVLGFIPMAYLRVSPRADHLEYLALAGWAGGMAALLGLLQSASKEGQAPFGEQGQTPFLSGKRGQAPNLAAGERAGKRGQAPVLAGSERGQAPWLVMLLGGGIAVLFVVQSRSYAVRFRSEEELWTYGAAREPGAWVARSNLGKVRLDQGRTAEARTELAEAARLQPNSAEVRANWGNALERLSLPADALVQYQAAVRIDPQFAGGHYNLGRAWLQRGQAPLAVAELRTAVSLDPDYAAAHNNLGLALAHTGQAAAAEEEYRAALRIAPSFPEAHLNLGNAYFRDHRVDAAIAEFRAALQADPTYAAARHNLDAVLGYQAQHPAR